MTKRNLYNRLKTTVVNFYSECAKNTQSNTFEFID